MPTSSPGLKKDERPMDDDKFTSITPINRVSVNFRGFAAYLVLLKESRDNFSVSTFIMLTETNCSFVLTFSKRRGEIG